jgi:lysophospholipase L1-like esterase
MGVLTISASVGCHRGSPIGTTAWLNGANIIFDGNSLTAGLGSTGGNDYPAQLIASLTALGITGITYQNFGVSSQTTQMMAADAAAQVDTQKRAGVENILFAWEVGNDIYFNGNAATAETDFKNYCLARKAAGWKVIIIGLTPRNQSTDFGDTISSYNAKLLAADTWLKANYATFADAFVDIRADSRLNDYTNTTYYYDGIHFKDAGYAVVAALGQTKLLALAH